MLTALEFCCRHRYTTGFLLDLQFSASNGVTAIVGPSGSGKTTVLSMISGLILPTEGNIRLNGRTLLNSTTNECVPIYQRRVGMLFQDSCLFPHMTVRGNIEYGLRRRNAGTPEVRQLIEELQLGDLLHRHPDSLSGGQKQRVALARTMASQPEILLLDEPLTSVEPELQRQILSFLRAAIDQFRIPTVVVSHNRELVASLADSVLEIESGKLRAASVQNEIAAMTSCDVRGIESGEALL
ncbi:MAG: ATP-binding cassette domain-containing protein [Planctomycetota bacterium]